MAARTNPAVLIGVLLVGVAFVCSAVFLRRRPEDERPAPSAVVRSSPAQRSSPPDASAPDAGELRVAADRNTGASASAAGASSYETVLIKSTATRRHWKVDPREVRAVAELRDAAFRDLVLSANFGGGLRVEQPGCLRLGLLRDLEAGDVVREINGTPIRDETQFRLLAGALWKKSAVARTEVDRAGSSLTITYQQAGAPLPPPSFR